MFESLYSPRIDQHIAETCAWVENPLAEKKWFFLGTQLAPFRICNKYRERIIPQLMGFQVDNIENGR
jgi:hypothetical protein